jgi:integrase
MQTTHPIKDKRQIRELAAYFLKRGEIRNHALFALSVHTALRISDLRRLTWDDVYDHERGRVRESFTLTEKKTGKTKTVLLNRVATAALRLYAYAAAPGKALFLSRKGKNQAISRQQAYRVIRGAAEALGLAVKVSCHSLRKTFGYLAWRAKVSPMVIMKIYNHSSLAVTQRYLGITQDNLDECYRKLADIV